MRRWKRGLIDMTTGKVDSLRYAEETEREGEREKVSVPIRCHKDTHEEELTKELGEEEVQEIPRRWYIY
jgi:hypothetical protein